MRTLWQFLMIALVAGALVAAADAVAQGQEEAAFRPESGAEIVPRGAAGGLGALQISNLMDQDAVLKLRAGGIWRMIYVRARGQATVQKSARAPTPSCSPAGGTGITRRSSSRTIRSTSSSRRRWHSPRSARWAGGRTSPGRKSRWLRFRTGAPTSSRSARRISDAARRVDKVAGGQRNGALMFRARPFALALGIALAVGSGHSLARRRALDLALARALDGTDIALVRTLLRQGASPRVTDRDGSTTAMFMARCGSAAEVAAMLDAGSDVNARTHTGFTALLAAAGVRQETTVKLLLDRGADPRRDGDCLLRFAVRRSPEMVELLLAHGAGRKLRSIGELKRGGDFSGSDLHGAHCAGMDLRGDAFVACDLRNADLRGADLRQDSLRRCDLRGADLRGADLRGTALIDCDLRGCRLEGGKLAGLSWCNGTSWSKGFNPGAHGAVGLGDCD